MEFCCFFMVICCFLQYLDYSTNPLQKQEESPGIPSVLSSLNYVDFILTLCTIPVLKQPQVLLLPSCGYSEAATKPRCADIRLKIRFLRSIPRNLRP